MADLTVSSDIDSFLQSASRQAAMDNLAGATTSGQYLRGNGSDVVMSAIQAGDVPALNQNTTGTAAGLSATLAVGSGGTGQTTYTDGQILIGNSTGNTLAKTTLTAGTNVTITNGPGTITLAAVGGAPAAGTYLEFFEHFLSNTSLSGNLAFANTGGVTVMVLTGYGVASMSTGAGAVANQQSRLTQAGDSSLIGNSSARVIFRAGQNGATWFDATLTGAARFGWGSSTSGESSNAIYFRLVNSQTIEFVTKSGGVEAATNTGVSFSNGTFQAMEILINAAGTEVVAKIDGAIVATHDTNIPIARMFFLSHITRVSTTGTAVLMNMDFIYSKITPVTPYF